MIPRELVEGVQKMLNAGAPRETVWDFLLERGWSEGDAKEVFASIDAHAEEKKKEVQEKKVTLRAVAPKEAPPLDKSSKKTLGKEVPEATLPIVGTISRSVEPSQKKNLPLVVEKKEQVGARHVVRMPIEKRAENLSAANTKTEAAKKDTVRPGESSRKGEARPALKDRSRFVSREEGEEAELFEMDRLSSPFRLFSTALVLVKQRFWNLFFLSFMVSVLYLVIYIVLSYVLTNQNIESVWGSFIERDSSILLTTSILVVLCMVVGFVGAGLLLWLPAAYVLAFSGRASSFRDLFTRGLKAGFSFFIAIIFVLLFVLSGSVLLLIPGLVLSVWFVFAPIITVAERTSPFVALLVSKELVRNHFWDVVLREAFLLIPTLLAAIVLLLLLSPLSLLDSLGDSLGLGIGLVVLIFVSFSAILFFFAFMLFFFAYHVALYKEMHARAQSIKLSSRFAGTLPFLLIIPLLLSLAVALYVSSLF